MEKDYLGLQEAADHLGKHRTTIYRWIKKGRLPAVRVGNIWLVRRSELSNFVIQGTIDELQKNS